MRLAAWKAQRANHMLENHEKERKRRRIEEEKHADMKINHRADSQMFRVWSASSHNDDRVTRRRF